jgi:import receptor subunit TOM70
LGDFPKAIENYTKSTQLDDKFAFGHIQLAVAQYKDGQIGMSMITFRRLIKTFPNLSEPYNY